MFSLPSTLQSNALSCRREPLSGTELPQAPNIEQLPFLYECNEDKTLIRFYKHFTFEEEKMILNSSIQTNLKPFQLMESITLHF